MIFLEYTIISPSKGTQEVQLEEAKLSYKERKAKLIERLNAFNSIADDE